MNRRLPLSVFFCVLLLLSRSTLGAQYFIPYFSGSVGIGTSAPTTFPNWVPDADERVLTITGSGNSSALSCGVLNLSNNRATAAVGDALGGISFGHFHNSGSNMGAMIGSQLEGSGGANGFGANLGFWTKNDNVLTHTEKMRITSSGNVGIGTSSPGAPLDILGGVNGWPATTGTAQTGVVARMGRAGAILDIGANGGSGLWLQVTNRTDLSQEYPLILNPNGGSVGIGTTSPSQKLDVRGAFRIANTDFVPSTTGTFLDSSLGATSGNTYARLQGYTNGGTNPATIALNPVGGNIGIGTTAPATALQVIGDITLGNSATSNTIHMNTTNGADNSWLGIGGGGAANDPSRGAYLSLFGNEVSYLNLYGSVILGAGQATGGNGGSIRFNTDPGTPSASASATRMFISNNGNVGINTLTPGYKLHVVGTAGLSTGTAWTNASDARLKDVHGDYEYGLNEILKLRTVRFNYKKKNPLGLPSDHAMVGFIAQEVQKVIPEAVHQNKNGYLDLNVDPIHWAAVNAIQELHRQLTATVAELHERNQKIQLLEDRVARLEKALQSK